MSMDAASFVNMRGKLQHWDCRAGRELSEHSYRWDAGPVRSDVQRLAQWAEKRRPRIRWFLKQAAHGFQGTTGSFED